MKKRKKKSNRSSKSNLVTKTYLDLQLAKQAKEFDKKLEKLSQDFTNKIIGLGGRWGKDAEETFRIAIKEKIEKEFGGKVEKWRYKGKIPEIDLESEEYEVDVVVSNGKVNLMEIKMSVYKAQVMNFERNARAYEIIEGKKADRKIMVTPFADIESIKLAGRFNIELLFPSYTWYTDYK